MHPRTGASKRSVETSDTYWRWCRGALFSLACGGGFHPVGGRHEQRFSSATTRPDLGCEVLSPRPEALVDCFEDLVPQLTSVGPHLGAHLYLHRWP